MLTLLTGVALTSFTACSDDDIAQPAPTFPDEAKFEVLNDIPVFSFSDAGNTAQKLYFNVNREWHVEMLGDSASYSWLTVFDRHGDPGDSVRVWIAAAQNTETDPRRAAFQIVSDKNTKYFKVYQAQKDAVIITDPEAYQNLSAEHHVIPVEFALNTGSYDVQISTNASDGKWIKQTQAPANTQTRAMESHTEWFDIAANDKFDMRTGQITFKSRTNGSATETMNIFQFGLAKPVIHVKNKAQFETLTSDKFDIDVTPEVENVSSVTGQLTVNIPATDREWITFDPKEDGTGFIVHIAENEAGERSSVINVCAQADFNVRDSIIVKQASAEGVSVTLTNKEQIKLNQSKNGGAITAKVNSLVDKWDAKIVDEEGKDVSWIRVANKVGNMVIVQFDKNEVLYKRAAVLKVFPAGNEAKADKVNITQSAGTTIYLKNGVGLQKTLENLIKEGYYESLGEDVQTINDITHLDLGGKIAGDDNIAKNGDSNGDWGLLKKMMTKGKGYSLVKLDLTNITNGKLPNQAFRDCNQLQSIVFPKGAEDIACNAVMSCTALRSAKIHEGTKFLRNEVFNGCTSLNEVWIPSTMTYMFGGAFQNCKSLRKIHIRCLPLQIWRVVNKEESPKAFGNHVFQGADNAQQKATYYMPANNIQYFQNVDMKHVVAYKGMKTFIETEPASSSRWKNNTQIEEWVGGGDIKSFFVWPASNGTTKFEAEEEWSE